MIMQGMNKTLEAWITTALPQEILDNAPWLLYWLGICTLPFNPLQSRSLHGKAFHLFDEQKDAAGLFLAWAAVIDTYVLTWSDFSDLSRWIDELYRLREQLN